MKISTAKVIAERIESGDLLAFGYVHSGFEPLFKSLNEFACSRDVDVFIHCVLRYTSEYLFPLDRIAPHFGGRFLITQIAPEQAGLLTGGNVDILPLPLSQVQRYLKESLRKRRVWLFSEISPPDGRGLCNTGYSALFPLSLYPECICVGLVNDKMPPTFGDTSLRAETFQYFVEMPSGLPFYPEPALTDAMMRAGQNAAHLIDEGATIQTGMGEVPYAVLRALSGRKNLRFQSGILPEEVMALIEEGCFTGKACCNVTNARSGRFYDWLKLNPAVEIRSLDYTHDVNLMSQQHGFTSINSAICVDLFGQVVLETLGSRQISGIGGALDYARASGNGNGKSIIAMTSTYGEENRTKIVPLLNSGEIVSLTRHDVNYVVTEFGVAELRHRSRQERARNLISVAHPKHREDLMRRAREIRLI